MIAATASVKARPSPHGSISIAALVSPVAAAIFAAFAYFNFIQNHFATGGYMDAGWFAHLTYKSSLALYNPQLTAYPFGESFHTAHVSPILWLLSLPSNVLPFSRIGNFSLIFGFQGALLTLAGAAAVYAARPATTPLATSLLAAMTGLALSFSTHSLLAVSHPHFEPFFAPFAIFFFVCHAAGKPLAAAVFFCLTLAVREDTGFHLFGFIALLILWERWVARTSWDRVRTLAIYAGIAFAYSVACVVAQKTVFAEPAMPGPANLLTYTYIGDPPYGHVNAKFFAWRFPLFVAHRPDLLLAVAATAILAAAVRRPQYLLGYAACVPWAAFNFFAIRDNAGTLHLYYGFPLVLALAWPIVYEALDRRLRPDPPKHPRRATAAVLATIAIPLAGLTATPHALWVFERMLPVEREEREAVRVLGDFLDRGFANELGLTAYESAASLSPNQAGRLNAIGRHDFDPHARGVIFFAQDRVSPQVLSMAASGRLDGAFEFVGSPIRVAFRSEDRERIRAALAEANAGRVNIIERGLLYSALRAGPAGVWDGWRLGTAPGPAKELVAFGPYVDLEPGRYRVRYRLDAQGCAARSALKARVGVTANSGASKPADVSTGAPAPSVDGCQAEISANFTVTGVEAGRAVEFPLWNDGDAAFSIADVSISNVDQEAPSGE